MTATITAAAAGFFVGVFVASLVWGRYVRRVAWRAAQAVVDERVEKVSLRRRLAKRRRGRGLTVLRRRKPRA